MATEFGASSIMLFTEEGLALAFSDQHGGELRYVATWGRWLLWSGQCWKNDETLKVFDLARAICRNAAAECSEPYIRKSLARSQTVAAVERLARSDRRHAATADMWDFDPWSLNTPDGLVDLRTSEVRGHRPEQYMTKLTAVGPKGNCPRWREFLKEVTDRDNELQTFLQIMAGYALTGLTREQALFFLYGTGANGKSVFLNTVSGILGDYHAQDGGAFTVAKLRGWIDQPEPMGLPKGVENLVILTFADQTNRSFFLHGGRITPSLDNLPGELELREQALPSKEDWQEAVRRAQLLFGLTPPEVLNAANVGTLVDQVTSKAKEVKPVLDSFSRELPTKLQIYGVDLASADRLSTTRSSQAFFAALTAASDGQVVSVLANAELKTSDTAMAQTIGKAKVIDEVVRTIDWDLFEAVGKLADHRKVAAEAISKRVSEILAADEHAIALKPAMDEARRKALRLLTETPSPRPPRPHTHPTNVIERDMQQGLDSKAAGQVLSRIEHKLTESPNYRLDIEWEIRKQGTGE